ncbi:MAG: hypothetical protein HON04_13405 [Planctomicrobium sp.]|jgi:hypothetical protein|nr:hypothetical protein [Planctomicrobium sp.]
MQINTDDADETRSDDGQNDEFASKRIQFFLSESLVISVASFKHLTMKEPIIG